jgi:hypothetical protein
MVKLMRILNYIMALFTRPNPSEPVITNANPPRRVYIPPPIERVEDTAPAVCPMNEGDELCIHRSHDRDSIILVAHNLGYELTLDAGEQCHYMPDHDHYPVTAYV